MRWHSSEAEFGRHYTTCGGRAAIRIWAEISAYPTPVVQSIRADASQAGDRVIGTRSADLAGGKRTVMADSNFWLALDRLVDSSTLIIDRPRGLPHPRHASWQYPLDYGYLQGTRAPDGGGIDIWLGSLADTRVTGVIVTVDLDKGDGEFKLLLGCTANEARTALDVHNQGSQAGILVTRSSMER